MFINITDSLTASNKGSSNSLVNYLEKENRSENKEEKEYWFNEKDRRIEPYDVRNALDRNVAKLCKTDAKFFLINISPSQKEIKFLNEQYGEKIAKEKFKEYAEKVMDQYAANFQRPGVNSAKDLLWFGKLENNRYYTYKDKEVSSGLKKRGELKTGEQMHIQIIVSRKDFTNRIRLSPMNTSRGKNVEHSKKLGQFNRVAFKQSGETLFDHTFKFHRNLNESMVYANLKKHGSFKQREQLSILENVNLHRGEAKSIALDLAHSVAKDVATTTLVAGIESMNFVNNIFSVLMEPVHEPSMGTDPGKAEEKRRKKKKHLEQGISR